MDLIAEIWLCLALAALLGGVIGWLLRGARCSRELQDLKARWQNRLGLLRTDLDDARHKLAEAHTEQSEQEAAVDSLRLEIEQREARAVNLQSTIEGYENDIEKKNSQTLELSSALDANQLECEKLKAGARELEQDIESLRSELEAARGAGEAGRADLDTARAETEAARAEAESGRASLETARAETEAARAELEAALAQCRSALEDCQRARDEKPVAAVMSAPVSREATSRELEERDARIAELERQLAATDRLGAEPDPLQRIHGVGPVLEKMLHSIGVFTFRQIAAWDEADIAWAAAKLDAFPDRIERDEWVAQAARFQHESRDRASDDRG